MSQTYAELPNTNYPDDFDVFEYKTDANINIYPLIQQYKTYLSMGNIAAAKTLLDSNPDLKKTIITASDFNKLQDAISAMQRFFVREQRQIIFSASQPADSAQSVGDIWVKVTSTGSIMHEKTAANGYVERMGSSASKLSKPVNIGNASFDGTSGITLAQIGAATSEQGIKADNAMPKANFSFNASTGTLNITL